MHRVWRTASVEKIADKIRDTRVPLIQAKNEQELRIIALNATLHLFLLKS
jgi:hypothetical protein